MEAGIAELGSMPGAEIVIPGIEDLQAGRETIESAAVLVARSRLREGGLDVPGPRQAGGEPGHRLYELIVDAGTVDPHSRYNAILRRLDSFARALEYAGRR